jgi:hypothetical protein
MAKRLAAVGKVLREEIDNGVGAFFDSRGLGEMPQREGGQALQGAHYRATAFENQKGFGSIVLSFAPDGKKECSFLGPKNFAARRRRLLCQTRIAVAGLPKGSPFSLSSLSRTGGVYSGMSVTALIGPTGHLGRGETN